jgi:hypothetical protein
LNIILEYHTPDLAYNEVIEQVRSTITNALVVDEKMCQLLVSNNSGEKHWLVYAFIKLI